MRNSYIKTYGERKAEMLLEMEQGWMDAYNRCIYIDWEDMHSPKDEEFTSDCAAYLGWDFEAVKGDPSLLKRFIEGDWNEEDFLVVAPGQTIAQSFQEDTIIEAE